jgi:hypothetical protein
MLGIPKSARCRRRPNAIKANPKLKVLVAQGAFDPLGGCSINSERARRLESPYKEAITWKCYDGAHQMYLDAPARTVFSNDVKALIARGAAMRCIAIALVIGLASVAAAQAPAGTDYVIPSFAFETGETIAAACALLHVRQAGA